MVIIYLVFSFLKIYFKINNNKLENKVINGPYIHHMSEIYGNYSHILKEFCKYIPEISFDPLED